MVQFLKGEVPVSAVVSKTNMGTSKPWIKRSLKHILDKLHFLQ